MASDLHTRFHETWLGMVQPIEGLVVSLPVLVDSQCMEQHGPELQETFRSLCPLHDAETGLALELDAASSRKKRDVLQQKLRDGRRRYLDLAEFLESTLGWTPDLYDIGDALPENLSRYIAEGHQTIQPTLALRRIEGPGDVAARRQDGVPDIETPESQAGNAYVALVWQLPTGLALDKPETETGEWRYPPAAKFDRLLRACRVPIGLLSNGEKIRLIYAPHGEATGAISFDLTDMGEVGGRPILDAFVMLLSAQRFFGVKEQDALPALLNASRERQANVTNTLAGQVFDALDILLRGFEAAAHRDSHADLAALIALSVGDDPETRLTEDDHLYGGLLTVLLRLVFLLYAEDRELLPTEHESYIKSMSLRQLFEDLQRDHGTFPDTMSRRFGAWPRVLSLFRTIYDGVEHAEFHIPRRRGELFDPSRYPFLESWQLPDTAVATSPTDMAQVGVPTLDDDTIYRVLEKLVILEGQRLSYKVLDVEQIGSVYEALMGYGVLSLGSPAVCCGHKSLQRGSRGGVWIEAGRVLEQKPANRSKFLIAEYDLVKSRVGRISKDLKSATNEPAVLEALDKISIKKIQRRGVGQLALQPGEERRRTSSHYTPRALSEPIVRRTLEPLLVGLSDTGQPTSAQLLGLKICDPAMGSGAFLVEACRFLGDHLVAAWEREGRTDRSASAEEDVVTQARRLVAQVCLYGVDKNPFAVTLAKLSLWLVTLAKDEPFTFVDHCLCHGDSVVGLDTDQINGVHWNPSAQLDLMQEEIESAAVESIALRERIRSLAGDSSPGSTRLKEQLLWDAKDAQVRTRFVADNIVGAFLEEKTKAARGKELKRRAGLIRDWLGGKETAFGELAVTADRVRRATTPFYWRLEFPEVFASGGGFAAVCGNPPWGAPASKASRDFLKVQYDEVDSSTPDLFAYFVGLANQLAGRWGYILPDSFLSKDFSQLRQSCTARLNNVSWVENMSVPEKDQLFKDVQMDVCLVTVAKDPTTHFDAGIQAWATGRWQHRRWRAEKQDVIRPELDYVINLRLQKQDVEIWESLRDHPSLGKLVGIHEGIHSGNIRDRLFTREPTRGDERPLFLGARAGDHIEDFFAKRAGWYVDYRKEVAIEANGRAGLGKEKYFTQPKVYVTRTGNPFKAFVDRDNFASNNFFSVQFLDESANSVENLTYLAAYVRSKISQYIVRTHLAPRMGGAFTETKIKHLKRLPFPKHGDPELLRNLVAQVELLRALKAEAFDKDEAVRGEALTQGELKIEYLVARMLGLSEEATEYILARRAGKSRRVSSSPGVGSTGPTLAVTH